MHNSAGTFDFDDHFIVRSGDRDRSSDLFTKIFDSGSMNIAIEIDHEKPFFGSVRFVIFMLLGFFLGFGFAMLFLFFELFFGLYVSFIFVSFCGDSDFGVGFDDFVKMFFFQ